MKRDQVEGVIRHGITTIGGFLIAKGFIDEVILTEVIGAALSIVGIVWSIINKK